jgi:hypothetical protein
MAYNQAPGRGNFPKTGNGLPDTFRQDTDPPTEITTTPKYTQGVETYQKKLTNENQGRADIKINPTTSEASANKFKRNVKEEGGYTTITGSGGQVFRGRTGMKATENAVKASAKKVEDVNSRRMNNANTFNVFAGVKDPSTYTESDKKGLIQTGKALKV